MSLPARVVLQEAFLLHRKPYRETSLLLDLLTRDHGVVRLIGKGVLRSRNLPAALLRPFCPLTVSWAGRSTLPTLLDVEAREMPRELGGKPLFCGFYVNELLIRLLPEHDPQPAVFALYEAVLHALEDSEALEARLRLFELALLDELGYGPDLLHEADSGAAIKPDAYYFYHAEVGARPAASDRASIRGSSLLALRAGTLADPETLREVKQLMRGLINHHLGGRPLRSRELFKFTQSA